jgi:hypothetical protein
MTAMPDREGALVVAWTDEREGQGDILLSWYADGTWSEDLPLPGASGPDEQRHPSIALDDAGNLHAAWVTRDVKGGSTRIRYRVGRHADRRPSNAFRPEPICGNADPDCPCPSGRMHAPRRACTSSSLKSPEKRPRTRTTCPADARSRA